MRYLTGTDTGLWVAPILAVVFVAYTWIVSRLVHRGEAEVVGIGSAAERKAA